MRKVFKKIFKILKKHKIFFLLSAIVLLSLFFYTYNLKATQAHLVDTARDILHALRLWKDKEITLIGPPVTTFQHPHHKIFFSSLSLYIALVGLIVTNFNVLGAIIPIIFLLLASIPLFYILTSFFTQNKIKRIIATVIYALSPVTVYYARFFWHPNFVIPLSILYWYLFLFAEKKDEKRIKIFYFLPGFIGGLILHFHYLSIAPIVLCFIYLLFQKKWKKSFFFFLGVFLSVSPLMLFEVRNEFYLTKSFWLHLTQKPETPFKATFPPLIQRPILPLLAIGGIRLSELHYSNFPGLSSVFLTPISIIIIVFLIKKLIKDIKSKNNFFILHVFVLITAIAILTKTYIYLHYFFSIYPILIWYLTETIFETKIKGLSFPILLPFILGLVLFSNIVIVTKNRKLTKYMIPLTTQEKIGQIIAKDNPTGRYNITEALTGDARATSFRYFVLSQAKNRPLDEEHYNNLDTIYVVAKNEQQTIDLETWEFKATKNLELTKRWKVGGLYLFRFDRGK